MTRTAAAVVALALITGCSKGADKPPAPPPPHVSVGQPLVRDVVDWDEYIGRFQAPQSVTLSARINGVVTQILFKDGQDVRAGQPLFIIDPRPYRATLEQAQAQIASARASLANATSVADRSAKLVAVQAVSKEELETDQATVRTDRATLQAAIAAADNARLNLSFTTVYSPVSGRVSSRRVSLGDQVTAQSTVLTTVLSHSDFTFDGAESFYLKYQRERKRLARLVRAPRRIRSTSSSPTRPTIRTTVAWRSSTMRSTRARARSRRMPSCPTPTISSPPACSARARLLGSGTYRGDARPRTRRSWTDQTRKTVFVVGQDGKVVSRVVQTGPR